jgi:hypothetical protein
VAGRRGEKETLVASAPQRGPHQTRIHAAEHAAEVLPAANRRQPGILVQAEHQNLTDYNSLMLVASGSSLNMEQPLPSLEEAEQIVPVIIEDDPVHASVSQNLDIDDDQMSLSSVAAHPGPSSIIHHRQMHDIALQQAPLYMPAVPNMQWPHQPLQH